MSYNPEGDNVKAKSGTLLERGDVRVIILRKWCVIYRGENFYRISDRLLNSGSSIQ